MKCKTPSLVRSASPTCAVEWSPFRSRETTPMMSPLRNFGSNLGDLAFWNFVERPRRHIRFHSRKRPEQRADSQPDNDNAASQRSFRAQNAERCAHQADASCR